LKFDPPNIKGTLVKRYKRFLADVVLEDGIEVTAHCPNTGSMTSCWEEGDTVYLSPSTNPKRKLPYTWELSKTKGGYIGINTNRPNQIVFEAIENGDIASLKGYKSMKREVKYGENSRIDILLSDHKTKPDCYIEIKNVTLYDKENNRLLFPDAVTTRGQKHLLELSKVADSGKRAVMFYLINRPEGDFFSPAKDIDPKYSELLKESKKSGVELLAYRVKATPKEIKIDSNQKVKIKL
jgi:sugar fermentation stimulation protein A